MKSRINHIAGTQGFKAATLIVLTLIMLIPISMVRSLISERSGRAAEVRRDISEAAGGNLEFGGPVLRIPGTRRVEKIYVNSEGKKTSEYHDEDFFLWYAPEDLELDIRLECRNKFRGIFYSPVFSGNIMMSGIFNTGKIGEGLETGETLSFEDAELVIPFLNQKGIRRIETAVWSGKDIAFLPGNRGLAFSRGGIYTPAPLSRDGNDADGSGEFRFDIIVGGAERVSILPIASSTEAKLSGNWTAPSFSGLMLPDSHNITDSGFTAFWNCSSLSSGIPVKWNNDENFDSDFSLSYIETDFISIHDHYEQNERAVKYAILFILLPYITLFMFEHFFRRRLHIIQYILAGIANIIFYLLLLSLSEHISFNASYLVSAASVTLLVCLYTFSILGRDRKTWLMAPVMAGIYTFLFVTLQSEDWALLIGSTGVFFITAILMFITRKIDFYQSHQNQK